MDSKTSSLWTWLPLAALFLPVTYISVTMMFEAAPPPPAPPPTVPRAFGAAPVPVVQPPTPPPVYTPPPPPVSTASFVNAPTPPPQAPPMGGPVGPAAIVQGLQLGFEGPESLAEDRIRSILSFTPGGRISAAMIQREIRRLMASGLFAKVRISCNPADGGAGVNITVEPIPGAANQIQYDGWRESLNGTWPVSEESLAGSPMVGVNDGVAGMVNGEIITESEVAARMAFTSSGGDPRQSAVRELIGDRLMAQRFLQEGRMLDEVQVDQRMDQMIAQRFGGDRMNFSQTIEGLGITEADLREGIRRRIMTETIRQEVAGASDPGAGTRLSQWVDQAMGEASININ